MRIRRVTLDSGPIFMSADYLQQLRTHHAISDCYVNGCAIHHPTDNVMRDFPYDWRGDTGVLERICPHGIGHPDIDSAHYNDRIGKDYLNIHSCDGCCYGQYEGEEP